MWSLIVIIAAILTFNINSQIKAQALNEEIIVQSSKLQSEGIFGAETYIINKSDIQNSTSDSVVDLITKFPGIKKTIRYLWYGIWSWIKNRYQRIC